MASGVTVLLAAECILRTAENSRPDLANSFCTYLTFLLSEQFLVDLNLCVPLNTLQDQDNGIQHFVVL